MNSMMSHAMSSVTPQPETTAQPAPVKGCDYSTSKPSISALKSAGIHFAVRYTSPGANPKNLTKAELTALLAAGLQVAFVFESTTGRMLGGHSAGTSDATTADTAIKVLGMTGLPVYFACDFDAGASEQPLINDYLDGAASVIGRSRTGIYGGYWPVSRALNAAKAAWAWQTYAWSTYRGTVPPHAEKWEMPPGSGHIFLADTRAQLRQGPNGVPLGGGTIDLDHAYAPDFGQWPRPQAIPPGKHAADGTQSMRQIAQQAGTTVPAVWFATVLGKTAEGGHGFGPLERDYLYGGDWDAKLTAGTVVWLP